MPGHRMILLLALVAVVWTPVPVSSAGHCEPAEWWVCDLDRRLSTAQARQVESMLVAAREDHGYRIRLATLPFGGELADLPGYGAPEGELRGGTLLLVVSRHELLWVGDEDLASRLEPKVMRFLERKHLCPVPPRVLDEWDLEQGIGDGLPILAALFAGRTPPSYYLWKVLEAPPSEPVNPGWQGYAVIAIRYLLAVALMTPQILLLAALSPCLRVVSTTPSRVLLLTGLVVILTASGLVLVSTLEPSPWLPYAYGANIFFLLATPIHLLLVGRIVSKTGLSGPWFAACYVAFPLAILLLATTGGWRGSLERLYRGEAPRTPFRRP